MAGNEVLYGVGDWAAFKDIDLAIEDFLDMCWHDPPAAIAVRRYRRVNVEAPETPGERFLEDLTETLDEDYGCPGGHFEPLTPEQIEKARRLIEATTKWICAMYKPWLCEPFGEPIEVNAREWMAVHRPEWLTNEG